MKAQKESFDPRDSAMMKHYSSNALKESALIRNRLMAIKALRAREEEEQRRIAIEAARKMREAKEAALREATAAAAAAKSVKPVPKGPAAPVPAPSQPSPVPVHITAPSQHSPVTAPIHAAPTPAPVPVAPPLEKRLEVSEVDIGSYEQNPEDYEKAVTLNRAKGIIEEAQKVLDSVQRITSSTDARVKKRRMELRMEINRRVGQVSNAGQQVLLVIKELLTLSNSVWTQEGQDMLHYCVYTMATKFIEQAETQIRSHAPSAFPYGQTVADLIGTLPAFKNVLMALLFQRCPYIIPRYPPRLPGQDEAEYRRTLGYKEGEADGAYYERMSGMVALYAAVIQSTPLRLNVTNPYDIKFAWLWLASIMNMRPRPITPYVIASFLDIAGYRMAHVLGKPFLDLMHFALTTFIPMIPSVSISPKTRLKMFVEAVLERGGRMEAPEGLYIDGLNYGLVQSVHRHPSTSASEGGAQRPPAPPAGQPPKAPRPPPSNTAVPPRGLRPPPSAAAPPPPGPTPGRPVFSPSQQGGSGKKKGNRW